MESSNISSCYRDHSNPIQCKRSLHDNKICNLSESPGSTTGADGNKELLKR